MRIPSLPAPTEALRYVPRLFPTDFNACRLRYSLECEDAGMGILLGFGKWGLIGVGVGWGRGCWGSGWIPGWGKIRLLQACPAIIYNMFLFMSKQQSQPPKPSLPKTLKFLQELSLVTQKKSQLPQFYSQTAKNLQKGWPVLQDKYESQQTRIKKSSAHWNYSDIDIVRKCIRKSMEAQTLSVLVRDWCEAMEVYVLEPMIDIEGNSGNGLSTEGKLRKLQRQLALLCEYLFTLAFKIYQQFFQAHYQYKSKLRDTKWTKQQIFLREKPVFEMFILNALTCSEDFACLYHQYIVIVLNRGFGKAGEGELEKFRGFLDKELGIEDEYYRVYKETCKCIWEFHNEPSLQHKLTKSTQLIPSLQQDHKTYYKQHKLQPPNKSQTITTILLHFLFTLYCPQAIASIKYIKLMICCRQGLVQDQQREKEKGDNGNGNGNGNWKGKGEKEKEKEKEGETFEDWLRVYCFLWLDQGMVARFLAVLDAFKLD